VAALRDRLAACDASIRSRLDYDEAVLAVGRCEDITEHGGVESGGAAWTYVMVTNRRLRWVPRSRLEFETALDLDDVTGLSEETSAHRYAISLEHTPVVRRHRVPHRLLFFRWGTVDRMDEFRRTKLAFSRADTAAVAALRSELARRRML
jgi:hypothetical protein